jgi:hypothetical protein
MLTTATAILIIDGVFTAGIAAELRVWLFVSARIAKIKINHIASIPSNLTPPTIKFP